MISGNREHRNFTTVHNLIRDFPFAGISASGQIPDVQHQIRIEQIDGLYVR